MNSLNRIVTGKPAYLDTLIRHCKPRQKSSNLIYAGNAKSCGMCARNI